MLYSCFVKTVSGAGDPSVNHIIILQGDQAGNQEISRDTDSDYHKIDVGGSTNLFYLLFGASGGLHVNSTQMHSIATAFLNQVTLSNLTTTLNSLHDSYTTITSVIPSVVNFNDSRNIGTDDVGIGGNAGLSDPMAMCHIKTTDNYEEVFMVADANFGLFKITGLDFQSTAFTAEFLIGTGIPVTSLARIGDIVYAATYGPFLVKINANTGELLNETEDGKFDTLFVIDSNPVQVDAIASKNGVLYAAIDGETHNLYTVNVDTGSMTLYEDIAIHANYADMTSVGTNPPPVYHWWYPRSINDDVIRITMQKGPDNSGFEEAPDIGSWEVDYNPTTNYGHPPATGWVAADLVYYEPYQCLYISNIDQSVITNPTIRMRVGGEVPSAWIYIYQND